MVGMLMVCICFLKFHRFLPINLSCLRSDWYLDALRFSTNCVAVSIGIIILTATTAKHGTSGSESMYLSQRMLILTFGRTSIYVHCFKYFDSDINTILIGCRKYQNVHSVFFQLTLLLQCHQFKVDSTVMEHRHHSWR